MIQVLDQMKAQLGWQGMAGLILLVLAGAFNYLSLHPLEQQTEFVRERIDQARSKVSMEGRAFGVQGRQRELEMFYDSLPAEPDVTDVLAKIYVVAEASHVTLKQGEYRLNNMNPLHPEYGMSFPVKGGYANIRAFLARILADYPALALDGISFHRDKIDDSVLSADIRLTLFLRE